MLVNGLKYIVPCQSRFSRTSIDQIITEQYQSIPTTTENCLREHCIPMTNQSTRESFQKVQTNLHQLESKKVSKLQQKRAQYEYRIVQSIQHVLRHRPDIVMRRTDKSNVFYIGKATDFIQKAAEYTGGGKIIGPSLVNAKKLTFYFKKKSVRLVNIFDRNIDICLYSLFSSFK